MWNPFAKRHVLDNPSYNINDYPWKTNDSKVIHDNLSVLHHPIVRRGITLIGDLAGTLPINVMKEGGISGREVDVNHPLQFQLNYRPTAYCNRSTWMQTFIKDAIVHGNAYNLITPETLYYLEPSKVQPHIVNGQLIYRSNIQNNDSRLDGEQYRTISSNDMLHIRSLTKDTIVGIPLAEALLDAMAGALAKYTHIRHYFENGTFSNLVWTMPPSVKTEEKANEFKNRIEAKHAGVWNSFKNIFISEGGDVKPLMLNNQAAQTQELLEFDIIVVAAALGLPPASLGANQNTSFASLEIEDKKMLRDINPWLIQIEQEFTNKLLPENDIRSGRRWIEFNRKGSIEMDSEVELDLLVKGLQSGIYSKEFVRRKLNVPIEDLDGETYFFPANLQTYTEGEEPVVPETPLEQPESVPAPVDNSQNRLSELTEVTLRRLIERVANSNKKAIEHHEIWNESLGMFEDADDLLIKLGDLIDGAKESRKQIAQGINIESWTTQLLKNDI